MLSDRCLSCPVLPLRLFETQLVYCSQTVDCFKMKLRTEIGLDPGHIVLEGDPVPLPKKGGTAPSNFRHVRCGQTPGWIKMPLGTEVFR